MKTKNGVAEAPQGGEPQKKVLTLSDVKGLLKRDLQSSMHMLSAIHDDVDTLNALAEFLHGKYMNAKHAEELAKQTELVP